MREREPLVDEVARRELRRIELTRREMDLAISAVDDVSIVVHRHEVVVRSDFLELSQRLLEEIALPEPYVIDRRCVGSNVGDGELHVAYEVARHDAIEAPG